MAADKTRRKVQVHIYRRDAVSGEPLYLVLRRPKSRGAIWQPVTGNVDPGEELDACALREVREETGLGGLKNCLAVHQFEFEKKDRTFRETVYVAECPEGEVRPSDEHRECRWLPYDEARRLIHFDSNRESLDIVHRTISGSSLQEDATA